MYPYNSFFQNSYQLEKSIYPSTNEWENQNMIYSYNGLLLDNKVKEIAHLCGIMDKLQILSIIN